MTPFGLPAQRTVRYDLKLDELKYVYGGLPPVLRVHAGDIIETNTVDADGQALKIAGVKVKGANPLTGPFFVEGAEPGDTLVVKFLLIDVDGKEGFGSAGPGFGALNSSHYTPILGGPIPKKSWVYSIDKTANVATFRARDSNFSVKIPLHPFLGCVGVAPAEVKCAARSSRLSSAATWTHPRPAWATRSICQSTCPGPCCFWEMATPPWAMAKSPAQPSKFQCA
jgi:acetamidase/formamidase